MSRDDTWRKERAWWRWRFASLQERASLREYFISELEPLLTPLAVDPGHPFPYLTSLALNLAIQLRDPEDPDYEDTEKKSLAIVTLPTRGLQRWVKIGVSALRGYTPAGFSPEATVGVDVLLEGCSCGLWDSRIEPTVRHHQLKLHNVVCHTQSLW